MLNQETGDGWAFFELLVETRHIFCPSLDPDKETEKTASFGHLRELFELEKGKLRKIAYKLNEKMLNPKPIETTNLGKRLHFTHSNTENHDKMQGLKSYCYYQQLCYKRKELLRQTKGRGKVSVIFRCA